MLTKSRIRQYLARRLGVPEIPVALERLSGAGFQPTHIFDVGAYKGDFAQFCLQIWPNAKVTCFEALEHRVTQLQQLASQKGAIQVFPCLLGAETLDNVPLHQAETASSVLVEQIPPKLSGDLPSDADCRPNCPGEFWRSPPDFLKLDVQGYELEVLKGAEKSLSKMQAILAEVNLLDIHQNVPLLAEVIAWFNERDWVTYDICGLTRRPLDQALWQADLIFVPRNSPLRTDKHWTA